jgi:hypothetical protein
MKQLVTIETNGQYARLVTLQYGQWYSKEELEEIKAHNMPIIEMATGTGQGSLLQQMIEAIEKGDDRPWWQDDSDTPWWKDTTRRGQRNGD